jgi:hypothetical protein
MLGFRNLMAVTGPSASAVAAARACSTLLGRRAATAASASLTVRSTGLFMQSVPPKSPGRPSGSGEKFVLSDRSVQISMASRYDCHRADVRRLARERSALSSKWLSPFRAAEGRSPTPQQPTVGHAANAAPMEV